MDIIKRIQNRIESNRPTYLSLHEESGDMYWAGILRGLDIALYCIAEEDAKGNNIKVDGDLMRLGNGTLWVVRLPETFGKDHPDIPDDGVGVQLIISGVTKEENERAGLHTFHFRVGGHPHRRGGCDCGGPVLPCVFDISDDTDF